ncbi:DNA helicase [Tersicoccus solisilvae]|uniref:DNA 3'-5' helicase n=1 Tax=Tersicoccus solisilvae TaxID=1882339 RepID=A0ABQ1NZA3_9MICC|nr:ATP-dependent DNA helicase [Tersicoccus solisilvae]GGC87905.1 DNA helicase [Tersicoccus solisilvae]
MSSDVVDLTGMDPVVASGATAGSGAGAGPGPDAPALDAAQRAIAHAAPGHGALLVLGGPGTGKSTVLVERAVHAVDDGADAAGLLLLAPSRRSATRLRDVLTARLDRTVASSPARSWQAYAFDLLRRARVEKYLALPAPPRLLSGAEQDQIIADLLSGHRAGIGAPLVWPADLSEALATRGFRQEVRQLFDRLTEYGLTDEDLARLGRDRDRGDWVAAARLYREYRDVLDLRMPEAFDPAGIITEARRVLQENPAFLAAERARLSLILVDDLQEANPAIHELLYVIGAESDIVLTASAESVVQGFRGARPDLLGGLEDHLPGLRTHTLTTSWRLGGATAAAWRRVADRIPVTGGATSGRVLDVPAAESGPEPGAPVVDAVEAHVVASGLHEARFLAQRLLEGHLREQRPWASMAVIVRTGSLLTSLARALTQQGVPVRLPAAERPVRDEVAVAALLDLYAVSLGRIPLTAELAVALLTSRFGGASALGLRRLRQQLRALELEAGGGRASDELLVESLQVPGALTGLTRDAQPARSIAGMLAAGTAAAGQDGATPETVLWALWEASGAERRWVREALAGGPAGERADRDLDAMMALFQTAERYVDQLPGASPAQFLDYVAGQEVPMDTLADRAPTGDAVELLTPASAAGREWDVVVVAGLQDGVWPNPRLRGELLGSTELVDILDLGADVAGQRDVQARLRQVRHDELRSFSVAVSRARQRLICVGVDAEDEQPSAFLDLVDPWPDPTQARPHTTVSRPVTLRALVAELRQFAQSEDPAERAAAVTQLARLAAVGALGTATGSATGSTGTVSVPGAHPDTWWGLLPLSTDAPIVGAEETVTVSPSRITAVQDSPLNWFVQTAGGQEATDLARSLGTLVHRIAERLPAGSRADLGAELSRLWAQLSLPDTWETDKEFERARTMVDRFADYVTVSRTDGRTLLHVEKDFEVELAPVDGAAGQGPVRAVLRGQVDRLEVDGEGRLFIADLKTGKHKPKKDDMPTHPQLGAYQVAVAAGGFGDGDRPGGAALINLGTGEKSVSVQDQEPLADGDPWAIDLVRSAASTMTGATFEARHQPGERPHCTLPAVCPLCAPGRQVTE